MTGDIVFLSVKSMIDFHNAKKKVLKSFLLEFQILES